MPNEPERFFVHISPPNLSNELLNTNYLNVYEAAYDNFITVEGLTTQSSNTNFTLFNIVGAQILGTVFDGNSNTQTISPNGLSAGHYIENYNLRVVY